MEKKVAILQSNYIPWKGYFDIINSVDEFILYDDLQYTKRDWRNRNLIKTPIGTCWITIPVEVKGRLTQKINEVKIADTKWVQKHWKMILFNYSKSNYFKDLREIFEPIYLKNKDSYLSEINDTFIKVICEILKIETKISKHYTSIAEDKTERLIDICKQAGATDYLTGPAASSYIQTDLFEKENIKISWMNYSGYPEYPQLFPPFKHEVTVLDLLFNNGVDCHKFFKSDFKR